MKDEGTTGQLAGVFPALEKVLGDIIWFLWENRLLLLLVAAGLFMIRVALWAKSEREEDLTQVVASRAKAVGRTVGTIGVLTAAAALAWGAAALLGSAAPVFAAVAAVVVGSTRAGGSLDLSVKTVLSTVGGLVLAEACVALLGPSALATLLTVALGLSLGFILGLGLEGAVGTAVTGVFASTLGPALTASVASDRILATILGATIGVGAAWLAQRKSPEARAAQEIDKLSAKVSELLDQMASLTAGGLTQEEAGDLLLATRDVMREVQDAYVLVDDLLASTRYRGPAALRAAEEISQRYRLLEYAAESANTMSRTMFDALATGTQVPQNLAPVMDAVGQAWTAHIEDHPTEELEAVIEQAEALSRKEGGQVRNMDDTSELILSASLLADMSRLLQGPAGETPAVEIPDPKIDPPRPIWQRPRKEGGGDTESTETRTGRQEDK